MQLGIKKSSITSYSDDDDDDDNKEFWFLIYIHSFFATIMNNIWKRSLQLPSLNGDSTWHIYTLLCVHC